MSDRRPFTITCVRRDPDRGYWTAHVVVDGRVHHVDRRYGSWHVVTRTARREVLPDVARALQDRVRPLERAESREQLELAS